MLCEVFRDGMIVRLLRTMLDRYSARLSQGGEEHTVNVNMAAEESMVSETNRSP